MTLLTTLTKMELCERCGMPADELHLDHDDDCPTTALGFCGCRSVCAVCCKTCNGDDA